MKENRISEGEVVGLTTVEHCSLKMRPEGMGLTRARGQREERGRERERVFLVLSIFLNG